MIMHLMQILTIVLQNHDILQKNYLQARKEDPLEQWHLVEQINQLSRSYPEQDKDIYQCQVQA